MTALFKDVALVECWSV